MDQKQRLTKSRLSWFRHFQKKSQNIAKTCRYFGISRPTYYFWWQRYQKNGVNGLCERSRKPKTSPRAINPEMARRIRRLRKKYGFGPVKIARHLLEKHNIKISPKTIYLILKKSGINKLSRQY